MQSNRLLSAMGRKNHGRLFAACDNVELCRGEVVWEPKERIRHVYFPIDSFISQVMPVDDQKNIELALVGNEGMLGAPLILGVDSSSMQTLVNGSGTALRMRAASFRRELKNYSALRHHLNRYLYVLQAQLALTAACISNHKLDHRLARQLLMTHDRVAGLGSFYLTHQILAQMLGVRRVGVTNAAGLLQERKLLTYRRGDITILNRAGLEKASCRCYQTSKDMYERILGT